MVNTQQSEPNENNLRKDLLDAYKKFFQEKTITYIATEFLDSNPDKKDDIIRQIFSLPIPPKDEQYDDIQEEIFKRMVKACEDVVLKNIAEQFLKKYKDIKTLDINDLQNTAYYIIKHLPGTPSPDKHIDYAERIVDFIKSQDDSIKDLKIFDHLKNFFHQTIEFHRNLNKHLQESKKDTYSNQETPSEDGKEDPRQKEKPYLTLGAVASTVVGLGSQAHKKQCTIPNPPPSCTILPRLEPGTNDTGSVFFGTVALLCAAGAARNHIKRGMEALWDYLCPVIKRD